MNNILYVLTITKVDKWESSTFLHQFNRNGHDGYIYGAEINAVLLLIISFTIITNISYGWITVWTRIIS